MSPSFELAAIALTLLAVAMVLDLRHAWRHVEPRTPAKDAHGGEPR